jgi:hypothetical protein
MRSLRLTWKNAVGPGWTRRLRWYEGQGSDIRIEFTDELRQANRFYTHQADAQRDADAFRAGASVKQIIDEGRGT